CRSVGSPSVSVALTWPTPSQAQPVPSPASGGGWGWGPGRLLGGEKEPPPGSPDSASAPPFDPTSPARGRGEEPRASSLHNNPPPPTLAEVGTMLRTLGKTELPRQLTRWLDELDETGRWGL